MPTQGSNIAPMYQNCI